MKTQLVVLCVLFLITYRQCLADSQVNLPGLFATPGENYYPPQQSASSLGGLNFQEPYLPQLDGSSADVALQASFLLGPDAVNKFPVGSRGLFQKITGGVRNTVQTISAVLGKVLSIPLTVLKVIFFPITITYSVSRFFVNLFFLPIRIAWKILNFFLHPVKLILGRMLTPEPTSYVYGISAPSLPPFGQAMYAS